MNCPECSRPMVHWPNVFKPADRDTTSQYYCPECKAWYSDSGKLVVRMQVGKVDAETDAEVLQEETR